jgi:hypothetical protein
MLLDLSFHSGEILIENCRKGPLERILFLPLGRAFRTAQTKPRGHCQSTLQDAYKTVQIENQEFSFLEIEDWIQLFEFT